MWQAGTAMLSATKKILDKIKTCSTFEKVFVLQFWLTINPRQIPLLQKCQHDFIWSLERVDLLCLVFQIGELVWEDPAPEAAWGKRSAWFGFAFLFYSDCNTMEGYSHLSPVWCTLYSSMHQRLQVLHRWHSGPGRSHSYTHHRCAPRCRASRRNHR